MRLTGSVVAGLVSGCAPGEADPTPTPTVFPSSPTTQPTTSTPTVAVPELPEAATVGDAAGAEAFVKHWVDVLNYAYKTGDTEPVAALSLARCELCASAVSGIEDTYGPGGSMSGGEASVELVRSPAPDSDGTVIVSTQYAQAALIDTPMGAGPTTYDAVPVQNSGFVLDFVDGAWMLVGIGAE